MIRIEQYHHTFHLLVKRIVIRKPTSFQLIYPLKLVCHILSYHKTVVPYLCVSEHKRGYRNFHNPVSHPIAIPPPSVLSNIMYITKLDSILQNSKNINSPKIPLGHWKIRQENFLSLICLSTVKTETLNVFKSIEKIRWFCHTDNKFIALQTIFCPLGPNVSPFT